MFIVRVKLLPKSGWLLLMKKWIGTNLEIELKLKTKARFPE